MENADDKCDDRNSYVGTRMWDGKGFLGNTAWWQVFGASMGSCVLSIRSVEAFAGEGSVADCAGTVASRRAASRTAAPTPTCSRQQTCSRARTSPPSQTLSSRSADRCVLTYRYYIHVH